MDISGERLVHRIDEALQKQGYKSRAILVEKKFVKRATISNWNHGQAPSAYTLYEIAKFLEVSVEYLITGETPEVISYSKPAQMAAEIDKLPDDGQKAAFNAVKGIASGYPLHTQDITSYTTAGNTG